MHKDKTLSLGLLRPWRWKQQGPPKLSSYLLHYTPSHPKDSNHHTHWRKDKNKLSAVLLITSCVLLITSCVLLITSCVLLIRSCVLLIRSCVLRIRSCVLLITSCVLLITSCVLLITSCVLLITSCVLLITSCGLLITSCVLLIKSCVLLITSCVLLICQALSRLGLINWIGRQTEAVVLAVNEESRLAVAILLILWVSALASAFVDNIPLTTMMIRIVVNLNKELDLPLQPLVWALAFGACLGG